MSNWIPRSEADLRLADESGLLVEAGQRLELKRELGKGKKANIELARDLASLAIEGGVMIIGVNDVKDRPPTLYPIPVEGESERIDQVATVRCDPPLLVSTHEISSAQGSLGYLAVEVPPSVLAPHMVDGKYWGRGDVTKRTLSDREVSDLIERRTTRAKGVNEELERYVDRDPMVQPDLRKTGRLFVVAKPLSASATALLDALNSTDHGTELRSIVFSGERSDEYVPNLESASRLGTRSDGWAFSSFEDVAPGRVLTGEHASKLDPRLFEIELSESGTTRLLASRVTDGLDSDSWVIFERMVAGNTMAAVGIAARVAEKIRYAGLWSVGVAIRGSIRGKPSFLRFQSQVGVAPLYADDSYTEFGLATSLEMSQEPGEVTMRLVGRFLRALGVEGHRRIQDDLRLASSHAH